MSQQMENQSTQEHEQWRELAGSTTSPNTNFERKDVFMDPCECIKKLFDAAETAAESTTPEDLFGAQKAQAMRTLRSLKNFRADVEAYEYAKTAEAVYGDDAPGKWRVAEEAQLTDYGLQDAGDLEIVEFKNGKKIKSAFKAQIYIPSDLMFCEKTPAALVFKGTVALEDWLNNLQQGIDVDSDYYRRAVKLGLKGLKNSTKPVVIAGHSLGGGLASACAGASGKKCWTFNAAGLHPDTLEKYGASPQTTTIEAYRHEGEILTAVQEPGWVVRFARVLIPPLAGFWVGGPLAIFSGVALAKKLRELPTAPGTKHNIPCIRKEWNGIDRHGMANTILSFNKLLRDTEADLRQEAGVQCTQSVIV